MLRSARVACAWHDMCTTLILHTDEKQRSLRPPAVPARGGVLGEPAIACAIAMVWGGRANAPTACPPTFARAGD